MKASSMFNFRVEENHVSTPTEQIFFYRILPPNLSIMTDKEKRLEITKMQGLFDTLDVPMQIFGIDKTENLNGNKQFYESLSEQHSAYKNAIVNVIESNNVSESSSIQRAYYLIVKPASPEKRKQLEAGLENQMIKYYPATKDELITILRNFLLREFDNLGIYVGDEEEAAHHNKKQSPDERLTRRLTPQSMNFTSRFCEQNGFMRKVLLIKNFPSKLSINCYLSELSKIKNTTFSMRIAPMTASIAAAIDRQVNNERSNPLARKKVTELIKSDMNQSSMAKFYRSAQEKNSKSYYVNIFIEMYGATNEELKDVHSSVRSILGSQHITFEELTYEQREGFLSVSPLGEDKFKASANNMPTDTLASLHPFSHSARNDESGMLLGETIDGGMMFVDFFKRTDDITNGNYTVIGVPGQGKSYLMKKILSQLIIRGTSCFGFDPESEYGLLFHTLGGSVIDCADGRIKINPFEVRRLRLDNEEYEEKEVPIEAFTHAKMFFQHLSWLSDFMSVLYPEATKLQIKALMILVQELYNQMEIDENTNFAALKSEDYPVFSDLYLHIEKALDDYQSSPHKLIKKDTLMDLLLIIKDCYNGSLGYVFNGYTNIPNSKNICFDIHDLLDGSEVRMQAVIFNVMTYVWSRICLREGEVCLSFDELALMINRKNYIIASYLKNFTNRARKYKAIIGTATQNINAYLDEEIYHLTAPIFNNTSFKFVFFPDSVEQAQVQKLLRFTDGEMSRIELPKQKHCLLKAGNQSYYMKVGALPYEKALFGKGGGE